jgi:DNA modification methylase
MPETAHDHDRTRLDVGAGHGAARRAVVVCVVNPEYIAFLARKAPRANASGIEPAEMPEHMFDYQAHATRFCLRQGRAALFLDTGLGKTVCELEFAQQASEHTGMPALILTPLAVARQIEREGERFGYDVRVVRQQSDVRPGINVCNYDRLDKLDAAAFGCIVLDESSILKSFAGKTTMALIAMFADTPFRLCATATPAPNDHVELGTHAEFLGVMTQSEMLVRWFLNDSNDTGTWRLKGHAIEPFWDWMSSWAVMAETPADLGYDASRHVLPPLNIIRHKVEAEGRQLDGTLFGADVSATNMFAVKRRTVEARAVAVAELIDDEQWLIWCDVDSEADALIAAIPGAVEIRGSLSPEQKEARMDAFIDGMARVLVTKSSISGAGLNLQFCRNMAFVGRSFSYEAWYQAVRRCWRFGQVRAVNVHLIVADGEDQIGRVIDRKAEGHAEMKQAMRKATQRNMGRSSDVRVPYVPNHRGETGIMSLGERRGEIWRAINGDCVDVVRQLPDASVGFSVYSPPFSNLFVYGSSECDMGNSADDGEFSQHYGFLVQEMLRVTKPGRLMAVHCSDIPTTKWKDGVIGINPLSDTISAIHRAAGMVLHSKITVWKDPVVEMTRTKALGLLYKQLKKDSTRSRMGMPDYVLVFRVPGENAEPVGQDEVKFPVEQWQKWASPVWMDIRQTNTLNVAIARDDKDERHLCPLQLDLIERAILMWSNPGDLVLAPFMGVGSEGFVAVKQRRRFLGVELKDAYYEVACRNLDNAERNAADLFAVA